MIVSVEVPVFKGGWLQRCIDSVLYQTSPNWRLSLLWDGGDDLSRRVLEKLARRNHPQVTVHFGPNRGIARARRYLSEHSQGDFILPVDDDDVLPFHAVERFLEVAGQKPWAAIIRGQRKIVDENGTVLDTPPWFPFEPRHYQQGMVTDLFNHTHPYLIRRSAYEQTTGWEGFEDFHYAGEDCDLYLKLEEVGSIELLDEVLYYYRINSNRASLVLTDDAAFEMWRRLADKTIERIGLPLRRTNEKQPFRYERTSRPSPTLDAVDFLILTDGDKDTDAPSLAAWLRRAGVSDDALHVVAGRPLAELNQAFRRTKRPIACLLDTTVRVESGDELEILLRLMNDRDVDLAAPTILAPDGSVICPDPAFSAQIRASLMGRAQLGEGQPAEPTKPEPWLLEKLMLVRREVVRAVGGLDEGFHYIRPAVVDFCLRARQRDFRLEYVPTVAFTTSRPDAAPTADPDLDRLRDKWGAHPGLLER